MTLQAPQPAITPSNLRDAAEAFGDRNDLLSAWLTDKATALELVAQYKEKAAKTLAGIDAADGARRNKAGSHDQQHTR